MAGFTLLLQSPWLFSVTPAGLRHKPLRPT